MCYGDIAHGKDGYYQKWAEEWEEERQHREQQDTIERQAEEEQYLKDYGSF
jgi:hypothetical protein